MTTGIIVSGFGFGGFLFGYVGHHSCNPDNLKVIPMYTNAGYKINLFPESVAENVPHMLRTLDIIFVVLIVLGVMFVTKFDNKDQSERLDSINNEETEAPLTSTPEQEAELIAERDLPIFEILKTREFVLLYLLGVCHLFFEYYMTNSYKQFGFKGGIDDRTLSRIGSYGALFNGCFKIFWAATLDYFEFKPVYFIVVAI